MRHTVLRRLVQMRWHHRKDTLTVGIKCTAHTEMIYND